MIKEKGLAGKILNGGIWVSSKVASKIALPAAVCSTIHDGSYIARGFGGVKTTFDVLGGVVGAYFNNSGVRDVINGASLDVMRAMGDAAKNIQEDPERVLYTALGTFVILKAYDGVRYASGRYKKLKDQRELIRYREQNKRDLEQNLKRGK